MNRVTAAGLAVAMVGLLGCGQDGDDIVIDGSSTTVIEITGDAEGAELEGPELDDAPPADGDSDDAGGRVEADGDPSPAGAPAGPPVDGSDPLGPDGSGGGDDVDQSTDPDAGDDPTDDPAAEGRIVDYPPGVLTDLGTGTTTDLDSALSPGRFTLLWFWSPESSTSEREAAVANRFVETFADTADLVAVGALGDQDSAAAFRSTTGLTATTLWAPTTDAGDHYGISVYPSSVLLDGAGNVVGQWPGFPEEVFRLVERIG